MPGSLGGNVAIETATAATAAWSSGCCSGRAAAAAKRRADAERVVDGGITAKFA